MVNIELSLKGWRIERIPRWRMVQGFAPE